MKKDEDFELFNRISELIQKDVFFQTSLYLELTKEIIFLKDRVKKLEKRRK